MSSREIAELLGNRHDHVKVAIERLAAKGIFACPAMRDVQEPGGNRRVYTTKEYLLDKRSSLIVVAQLSPEFTARVVDRWQELEAQVAGLKPQLPDFTNPVIAARAWADEFEGRLLEARRAAEAEEKLAIAAESRDGRSYASRLVGCGEVRIAVYGLRWRSIVGALEDILKNASGALQGTL